MLVFVLILKDFLAVLIRPLRRSLHECFCFDSRGFLGGPYKSL